MSTLRIIGDVHGHWAVIKLTDLSTKQEEEISYDFRNPQDAGRALIEAMESSQDIDAPQIELGPGIFDTHGEVKKLLSNRIQLNSGGSVVTFFGADPTIGDTVIL